LLAIRMQRTGRKGHVQLPAWVKLSDTKNRAIRNPEKLRKNQPKAEAAPAEEPAAKEPTTEENVESPDPEKAESAA
jgi:hypothetical protein